MFLVNKMSELTKNSIHTVSVDGFTAEGQGVARISGQVVFVKGAIPGETCCIKILKAGKNMAFSKIEEIITPSEHRVTPACPVFGKCGGCDLMHMDYDEELRFKRQRVNDALRRIGGLKLDVSGIIGSDTVEGYRNKTICAVGEKDGKKIAGFFRPHSHDIVPAENCLIQPDFSHRTVKAVLSWMEKHNVPAYDEVSASGLVRHFFCRRAVKTGEGQAVIVVSGRKIPAESALIGTIRDACPETKSIVLNVNNTRGNTVLSGDFITLWGSDTIEDELCGLKFSLSPRSFYQINHAQAEKLYGKALEYAALTGEETVLDLYCGTGTITLCLARGAKLAVGAEIVPEAIDDARDNAAKNGIANAQFICADAADAAKRLKADGLLPDVVVVDPPRKGLSPEVPGIIASMKPTRVVYVSCDPATLARDLKAFSELGYETVKAEAVDMFPRTKHVETVALLLREGNLE